MIVQCVENDLSPGTYVTVIPPSGAASRRLRSCAADAVTLAADGMLEVQLRLPAKRMGRSIQLIGGGYSIEDWAVVGTGTLCPKRSQQSHWRVLAWPNAEDVELQVEALNGTVTAVCKRHSNRLTGFSGFSSDKIMFATKDWKENLKKLHERDREFPVERMTEFIAVADKSMKENRWYGDWYRCMYAIEEAVTQDTKKYGPLPVGWVLALVKQSSGPPSVPGSLMLYNGDATMIKTQTKTVTPILIASKRALEAGDVDLSAVQAIDPSVTAETLLDVVAEERYCASKGFLMANNDFLYVIGKVVVKPKTRESIIKQILERSYIDVVE